MYKTYNDLYESAFNRIAIQGSGFRDMDGNEIAVNDYVGFKDDIETGGIVLGFERGMVAVGVWNSDTGCREKTLVSANRCWKE
jgi:hypothetical protein